ncbi:hypothetical protein P153DRAFT_404395 [Dothidotthia symphoricarpi CBS 119687]|uniref:Uncharacterized protein n=1 Tax=Dothidotthia symphoricarpi CBS 119687 TaxID=1392245 RepID=A0A6A6AB18_9PLEO|nr:uncharacterized protein P153DRAFT_404395 [Dothidotthia symphoricarpi CBS 119687]KAF2128345.1 hypothetical protein P153DRAFT_404395 [Dothidotthia symphoricarpi CBS 119687]
MFWCKTFMKKRGLARVVRPMPGVFLDFGKPKQKSCHTYLICLPARRLDEFILITTLPPSFSEIAKKTSLRKPLDPLTPASQYGLIPSIHSVPRRKGISGLDGAYHPCVAKPHLHQRSASLPVTRCSVELGSMEKERAQFHVSGPGGSRYLRTCYLSNGREEIENGRTKPEQVSTTSKHDVEYGIDIVPSAPSDPTI